MSLFQKSLNHLLCRTVFMVRSSMISSSQIPIFRSGWNHDDRFHPQVALVGGDSFERDPEDKDRNEVDYDTSIWFAVPKKRMSKGKKRMKNYLKRTALKFKDNIVTDGRTGELTLRHHLPFNWKDYLPEESIRPFSWDDFLPMKQKKICKLRPLPKKNRDQYLIRKTRNK